jgi:chromosome segregation ATPase
MSKRSRDGNVIVPCLPVASNPLKRRIEWSDTSRKRQMLLKEAESFVLEPSRKRGADFDTEINQLNKRLRATIPTAEEAISFLLPHISRLREMYLESKNENNTLKEHLETLSHAYYKTKGEKNELVKNVSECQQEIRSLRRQLEMTKYRLAMTDTSCKATMFQ